MIEEEKRRKHRVTLALVILQSLLIGVIIGAVVGVQLFTISTLKLGYWGGDVKSTDIVILSVSHQIRGDDRVTTAIRLRNDAAEVISCNCTLYYTSVGGGDLATYSFNITINAGDTYNRMFSVEPIDVGQWASTDVSIYEY